MSGATTATTSATRCCRRAATGAATTSSSPATAPPARPLPAGYTVRAFAGESEIDSRTEAHRSAFHPSKMTVALHRRVMASPTYRPEFDLVCAAADGRIAACTIVWFDEVNRVGIFEPVACHAEHQRRGLASALMTEGLRRLHARGATAALVMSHLEDSPGGHTYRRLGFEVIGRLHEWKKTAWPDAGRDDAAAHGGAQREAAPR